MKACPYGARSIDSRTHVAGKCTLCVDLREAGGICKTVEGDEIDLAKIRSYVCSGGKNLKAFYEIANGIL